MLGGQNVCWWMMKGSSLTLHGPSFLSIFSSHPHHSYFLHSLLPPLKNFVSLFFLFFFLSLLSVCVWHRVRSCLSGGQWHECLMTHEHNAVLTSLDCCSGNIWQKKAKPGIARDPLQLTFSHNRASLLYDEKEGMLVILTVCIYSEAHN